MAIAFDAVSALGQGNATSVNASMTVGSLTDGYLLVGLVYQDTTHSPTSLKWNTTETMTLLAGPFDMSASGTSERIFIYGLASPSSGSHNITCAKGADGVYVTFFGSSYSGVSQTGQPDSSGSGVSASTTALTVSTTVVAANSWLFGCFRRIGNSPTAGANTVIRADSGAGSITDSNGAQAAGSRSQTFNQTISGIGGLVISFKPVAAAPSGPTDMKTWNGLAKASVNTMEGITLANVKSWNGIT